MDRIYFVIIGAFCFLNVHSQTNLQVELANRELYSNSKQVFYALPKNLIKISFDLKQSVSIPGPYAGFAAKHMNISESSLLQESTVFEIINPQADIISTIDSAQWYSLSFEKEADIPLLQLTPDGILLGCNIDYTPEVNFISTLADENPQIQSTELYFTDLGVKPYLLEEKVKKKKKTEADSVDIEEMVTVDEHRATTTEENAEAAADFIRKLRKRKLKMLVAQKDEVNEIQGEAMRASIEELNQLESKYIELFIGKKVEHLYHYSFIVEPDALSSDEQLVVCWFSRSKGITYGKSSVRNKDLIPFTFEYNVSGKLPQVKKELVDKVGKENKPVLYGLHYRIPATIQYSLNLSGNTLAQGRMLIAQKGQVVPLPQMYLRNRKFGMEFCPVSGALLKIIPGKFSNQETDN